MNNLESILTAAHQQGASDIHLSSDYVPFMRLHGDMRPISDKPLTADVITNMLHSYMTEAQQQNLKKELEMDFAIALKDGLRFRVNAFHNDKGIAAVFRVIPSKILSLDDLNMPPILEQIAAKHKGLVLVTGPTGSGKSTTLAAMIDYINKHYPKHIITVEDPIEFVHPNQQSLISQREVGAHTHSFARALKSALREDPDVILVGELRDRETIHLALTAAETGHLVFGTLHTNSAAKTMDRIIDAFPEGDKPMITSMLSTSLEAIIAQILLPKEGGGRVAALEILIGTPAVRNLIREQKVPQIQSLIQTGSQFGMQSMDDAIEALIAHGDINKHTANVALGKAKEAHKEQHKIDVITKESTTPDDF